MKVLVTGGGGFIGGHLVDRALRAGRDVRAVDIKPTEEWYQASARA
jgi:GDP-D-mannose 3', 5'-epimerase